MNILNNVMVNKPKKNNFDLSYENKFTGKGGYLIPCYQEQVIPGDSLSVNTEVFTRFAPMLAPIMHRIDCKIDYFFVPNRLLWDEWEDFITGGDDGTELPSFPRIGLNATALAKCTKSSLADYMGIPPQTTANSANQFSSLPFRAYQLIWDEFYRDQNVQTKLDISKVSGVAIDSEINEIMVLRKRNWEKDYFTSLLPWPQKGTEVEIPLSISESSITYKDPATTSTGHVGVENVQVNATDELQTSLGDLQIKNIESIDATEVSINELRRATKLQRWLERAARTGSRYIEQIYSHFGVRSSDARLQRPEYLGGGKVPVQISEVLSTYSTTGDTPQGDMTGHGISVGDQIGFKRSFEEHGIVLGLCTFLPRTSYFKGLSRHWQKFDKFDYYWPDFANLGEQVVETGEIYFTNNQTQNETTLGYQQRYAEYKYPNFGSNVSGDFRDTLDFWHQSRDFTSAPTLNTTFLESEIDDRIFAVQDGTDYLWVQMYHKVNALRPIPLFSIPELG